MSRAVALDQASDDSLFGSKAVGLGDAARGGIPLPPGVALSGELVEAIASGDDAAIDEVSEAIRLAGIPARRPLFGRRRGRRRREFRRPASDPAQRPVICAGDGGGARDLVVGQLRLGDHLPPAGRPLHPPQRRRRRPVAARSPGGGRDVHAQPGHRRRRAADRGELGARRGGRRRPRDPGHVPGRSVGRGAGAHGGRQEGRRPLAARRRHGRGGGGPGPGGAPVPR